MMDLKEKLLSNIVKQKGPLETECWIWQGPFYSDGYGRFCYLAVNDAAHRVAYREFVGPIPDGLFVCHHCDNRDCVNSQHLYAGTHQQNMDDMWARGRANQVPLPGSLNGRAVLNEGGVREILQALCEGESQQVIADERGVPLGIIHAIASGRTWRHVPGPRPMKRKASSRFRGVTKHYDRNGNWKWLAQTRFDGKKQHLGTFCFEVDAAICVNTHIAYLGLDKPLNVIPEDEWCHD